MQLNYEHGSAIALKIIAVSVTVNFRREPSERDGKVIQSFKVTTLQLKKHLSYIKFGHSEQHFYRKSTGYLVSVYLPIL